MSGSRSSVWRREYRSLSVDISRFGVIDEDFAV